MWIEEGWRERERKRSLVKSDRCRKGARLPLKERSTHWPATKPQTRSMPFIFHKVFFPLSEPVFGSNQLIQQVCVRV